jgi:acyl-coenzyme A thioesterase PaaI-like protein
VAETRANRLVRALRKLDRLPAVVRPWARNKLLRRAVPFTGTARLDFVLMTAEKVEISVENHRRVQNHIHGVHAAAMALLAETATGMVVGMNVRDDCLPLAKHMKVDFKKRSVGAMRAVAVLTVDQRNLMQQSDKGEVSVAVQVSDESGALPIQCEFIWAWIPSTPRSAQVLPTTR